MYLHKLVLTTAENLLIYLCGIELSYAKFILKLDQLRNALETSDSDVSKEDTKKSVLTVENGSNGEV